MKILKGCAVFVFSVLLFFSITLFITFLNIRSTVISTKIPEKYIDQVDITGLASKAVEQGFFEDNAEEEGEDTNKVNRELLDTIDESDEAAIKQLLKENLNRAEEYLTNADQENLELSTAGVRELLVSTIVESPEAMKELHLPFEVCKGTQTKDCVTQEKLSTFLDKLFSGNVTEADIVEIIPRCPRGTSEAQAERQNCITQKQLDELDLDKAQEEFSPNDDSFEGIKDTYVIPQKDLENVQPVKDAIRISTLALIGLFALIIILSLFVILLIRKGSLKVFMVILVLAVIVQALLLAFLTYFESKLKERMQETMEQAFLRDEVFVLLGLYKNQLTSNMLIAVGVMLFLVAIMFGVVIFLNRKK